MFRLLETVKSFGLFKTAKAAAQVLRTTAIAGLLNIATISVLAYVINLALHFGYGVGLHYRWLAGAVVLWLGSRLGQGAAHMIGDGWRSGTITAETAAARVERAQEIMRLMDSFKHAPEPTPAPRDPSFL